MKQFDQIAIIGTGLIGGSLALAIKKKRLAKRLIGISRHASTLTRALKRKIIDEGSQDITRVAAADMVVFATPVETMIRLAPKVASLIRPSCVVTDVASTKQEVVSALHRLFPCYVGSHPLAGSEKRGIQFADAHIFQGALCLVTPVSKTNGAALVIVRRLWRAIGMRVVEMSPATHDRILAYTSHLPHVVAYSLMQSVPKQYVPFAAGGLRDSTRIAASSPQIWADVFLSNRAALKPVLADFQKHLHHLAHAITRNDRTTVERILSRAQARRNSLL